MIWLNIIKFLTIRSARLELTSQSLLWLNTTGEFVQPCPYLLPQTQDPPTLFRGTLRSLNCTKRPDPCQPLQPRPCSLMLAWHEVYQSQNRSSSRPHPRFVLAHAAQQQSNQRFGSQSPWIRGIYCVQQGTFINGEHPSSEHVQSEFTVSYYFLPFPPFRVLTIDLERICVRTHPPT